MWYTCNNDLTDIRLEDISKDVNVHTDFQHELMDSDDTKSTSTKSSQQLKEIVMQDVKKS